MHQRESNIFYILLIWAPNHFTASPDPLLAIIALILFHLFYGMNVFSFPSLKQSYTHTPFPSLYRSYSNSAPQKSKQQSSLLVVVEELETPTRLPVLSPFTSEIKVRLQASRAQTKV